MSAITKSNEAWSIQDQSFIHKLPGNILEEISLFLKFADGIKVERELCKRRVKEVNYINNLNWIDPGFKNRKIEKIVLFDILKPN